MSPHTFAASYKSITLKVCTPFRAGKALGECIATVASSSGAPSHEVGYEDVAEAAFGSAGKAFISTCMYTELYGICAVLFIIMVRRGRRFGPSALLPES